MSGAAKVLGVTPGAVSHQVRDLEERLGFAILDRAGSYVALTSSAAEAMPAIERGFEALLDGYGRLQAGAAHGHFTIAADPSFACVWLTPRLPALRAALGSPEVRIVAPVAESDMDKLGIDLAITYLDFSSSRLEYVPLMVDPIIPACTPALADRLGDPRKPQSVATLTLLHVDSVMKDNIFPGWYDWLVAAGVKAVSPVAGPRFGLSLMAARAAAMGQGAVLAPRSVIEADLQAGNLVEIGQEGPKLLLDRTLVWRPQADPDLKAATAARLLARGNNACLPKVGTGFG